MAAHPRSRGENATGVRLISATHGSSPLTRGKLGEIVAVRARQRLIPAHAGKTRSGSARFLCAPGSSPLTRGKPGALPPCLMICGLIPAHAGKTPASLVSHKPTPAHPRSRGENCAPWRVLRRAMGSSPLTRGKPCALGPLRCRFRLIPAHAGKTRRGRLTMRRGRAHPRSRGENYPSWSRGRAGVGSSPLTRGKLNPMTATIAGARLIPAHAGKTRRTRPPSLTRRAHPRSRGENQGQRGWRRPPQGSSPLTRGKLTVRLGVPATVRLIPAHAGKTTRGPGGSLSSPAHPRSRGENLSGLRRRLSDSGSSPLTRGKPLGPAPTPERQRLIPAHAGKTLPDLRFYCADRSDLGNP